MYSTGAGSSGLGLSIFRTEGASEEFSRQFRIIDLRLTEGFKRC